MPTNDEPSTSQAPACASEKTPEVGVVGRMAGCFAFLQMTLQSVRERLTGAPLPTPALISVANPFVKLSESTNIDVGKDELNKILQQYAHQPEYKKTIKEKYKMNKAMIKLFYKPTNDQSRNETAYSQCVKSIADGRSYSDLDPVTIFERLLSGETPRAHPNGISSLAFAFIATLSLSLYRDDLDQSSLERNFTSPYFDLSPLYGSNDKETDRVRTKDGSGMLWRDCFFEDRLDMLPDAVPALLILWNRFHNHTAKYLLWHNKKDKDGNDKWRDLSELKEDEELLSQDDQIFSIARSITCINFVNIVREDILKGLFGLPFIGPSIEVDILRDVQGLKHELKTGHCSTMEGYFLYDFSSLAPPSLGDKPHDIDSVADQDLQRRNYMGLNRNGRGYFDDSDLARVLFEAIDVSAGVPSARNFSERDREDVIRKIKQGRKWKMCTLNEFREFLGLKRLKSFTEWNSDAAVANAAKELYENIDNLELYPGLLAEAQMAGFGFGLGRTMTWGLISDIITRILSDPRFTTKFTEEDLTTCGYHDCMTAFNAVKPNKDPFNGMRPNNDVLTAIIPKFLHRALPHSCGYKNIYFLFPFTIPNDESKVRIKRHLEQAELEAGHDLDFARPLAGKVKVLRTIKGINEVFTHPVKFPSPYKDNYQELTGGYGYMLGFDDRTLHDQDWMLTLFSLLPDKGAAKRIGAAFGQKAREYIAARSVKLSSESHRARIDIIEDVIDATCVSWVCETIYDIDLEPKNQRKRTYVSGVRGTIYDIDEGKGKKTCASRVWETIHHIFFRRVEEQKKLAEKKAKQARKENEINAREDFAACYAYIFRNTNPETGFKVRKRALKAGEVLENHLKEKLRDCKLAKDDATKGWIYPARELYTRLTLGIEAHMFATVLPHNSAHTFLDRIMKVADLRPLKDLVGKIPHLRELMEKHKKALSEGEARERVEEQRIIANVIGISVLISVHFAKVCAQAVDFYLDDKYAEERKRLIELCKDRKSYNDDIMGYICEAQRIGQRFGLWRDVHLPSAIIIQQGHGYPDVIIEQGDRVFADFTSAHNDPKQFEEPEKVIPDRHIKARKGSESGGQHRKVISLLGLGVHKCPAGAFIDETMAEMFRVIFSQSHLERSKDNGRLKTTTLHPNEASWDPEVFLDPTDGYSFCPKHLMLEFDAVEEPKEHWECTDGNIFIYLNTFILYLHNMIIVALFECAFLILSRVVNLLARFLFYLVPKSTPMFRVLAFLYIRALLVSELSISFFSPSLGPRQMDPKCRNTTEIVPFRTESIRPTWLGMFGEPAPIIYHTPRGRRGHKISIFAIDKRDIQLRYWVDEEDRGTVPVELDPSVDCGDDVMKCMSLGFSAALIEVPPGRHRFKAEIVRSENQPFEWGNRRERRVKLRVDQCQ